MTWHNVALAALGVGTGLAGFLIPGAAAFTTPVAYTLIGGALGLAVPGMVPALSRLLAPPSPPPPPPKT